jgi:Na+/H+ antiporter NhaD/arsenite permease-like protein
VWAAVAIFAITYVLISARRLSMIPIGRPAGALLGACAMVALSVPFPRWGLSPNEAFAAVEPNTIALLLGMMLLAASLGEAGFFDIAADWLVARRLSPGSLLYVVVIGSGVLSALLVNDSVCLLLGPLVDQTARRAGRNRVPYLLGLAMGSNAGSAMTVAGNPQNMLVAHLSNISYREYLAKAGLPAAAALLTTGFVIHYLFRAELKEPALTVAFGPGARQQEPNTKRLRVAVGCTVLVSILFFCGGNLAWSALGAATLMMLLWGRDPGHLFDKVAWTVLLFFGALFIVVAGLQKTGLPGQALEQVTPWLPASRAGALATIAGALIVGCQVVSNVPFILLAEPWLRTLSDPHLAWTSTALFSTLAGNLTLLGSVANIIVIETTSSQREIGFFRYIKVGVPVTLASSLVGGVLLLVTSRW